MIKVYLISVLLLFSITQSQSETCDIVIAGGTLAALGAALQAPESFKVCLIQPTDRLGGQFGDQGVWHIDFNWKYQQGYPDRTVAYNPANLHPFLATISQSCNMGDCWVSRSCFLYSCIEPIIKQSILPKIQSGKLVIFYNSVVKSVDVQGSKIRSIDIISRQPLKKDCRSVDQTIEDWYTYGDSNYYSKQTLNIKVKKFVIEASQFGDVLVQSFADYVQGTNRSAKCGQSIVFGLHEKYVPSTQDKWKNAPKADDFSLAGYTVKQLWTYRRLKGNGDPKLGDVTLQNWNGPGNDYRDGYLFLQEGEFSRYDYRGGLNWTTLKNAQARSLRFHEWFKNISGWPIQITGEYFNTCLGVSRLPYVRDGRRSLGYKNFRIEQHDVTGQYSPSKLTSTIFQDRIGLGFYNMDIHSIAGCQYDSYPQDEPLPFFLPLRAFTNKKIDNLIPTGRAMSQQFYASSATRTHTTEFHSGVAAILMATYMSGSNINSTWAMADCSSCIGELQSFIRKVMPIEWTISGKKYP